MNSKDTDQDSSRFLRATKRIIVDGGVIYYVNPSTIDRNLQDIKGLKKNIFLITRTLKAGETTLEFRCDTIAAATYKKAEEKHLLKEKFKGHLYEVNEVIAEII